MELVTVKKAIELIKAAAPGDTLSIGLYKDSGEEVGYTELKQLLGYSPRGIIQSGAHKVFSKIESYITAPDEHMTGWVDVRAFFPDRELQMSSDHIAINGANLWYNDYDTVEGLITMIESTPIMNVTAEYDEAEGKIYLTAKVSGPKPNEGIYGQSDAITLREPENKSYWDDPTFQFISGETLEGHTPEIYNQGIHVWVKQTDIKQNVDYDISMLIETDSEETTIDLAARWLWDEYTEIIPENVSTIDWGDGTPIEIIYNANNMTHTYMEPGQYTVYINGLHWCGTTDELIDIPVKEINFRTGQVVTNPNGMFANLSKLWYLGGVLYIAKSADMVFPDSYFINSPLLTDTSTIKIHQ